MNNQELFEKALNEFDEWPFTKVLMLFDTGSKLFVGRDIMLPQPTWLHFICTREEFEAEKTKRSKSPVYTQEMFDNGELPSVGMMVNYRYGINLFAKGEVRGVDNKMFWIKSGCGGFVTYTLSKLSPIDTRTDKEKAVDELMVELSKNNNNDEDRASIFAFYDKWVGDENEK